jgi:hypothetical protein
MEIMKQRKLELKELNSVLDQVKDNVKDGTFSKEEATEFFNLINTYKDSLVSNNKVLESKILE